MLSNIKISAFALAILATAFLFVQCSKEDPDPSEEHSSDYYASKYLRDEYMSVYYYWADKVRESNKKIDLDAYTTAEAFDKMLYSSDRWSWMEDAESFLNSSTGTVTGTWGAAFTQAIDYYNDYGMYIKYILPGSPFEKYGITRGAKLWAIGDVVIGDRIDSPAKLDAVNNHLFDSPNTLTFKRADGTEVTFTESLAKTLKTDYVLCYKIFTEDDFPGLQYPVGYINYLSFKTISMSTIETAMNAFKEAGVKKLIVDLRYNGGGDSEVCQKFTSYLAPKGLEGKPYLKRKHNNSLSQLNSTDYLGLYDEKQKTYSDMSVGADELYFIMQHTSASSSEVTFNGLKPYMKGKIHHVGLQSYGKPNGMYVLYYPGDNASYQKYNSGDFTGLEYVFYPICFYNTNSDGEEIPSTSEAYSGFIPENERPDDIYNDFDVNESDIHACLTHIVTGSYPEIDQTHVNKTTKSRQGIVVESLTVEAQTAGNYGNYYVLPFKKNN